METSTTPKISHRRPKFVRPSPTTSYKSPLINKVTKRIDSELENTSLEDMKNSTLELWQKNENLKKEITDLNEQGFREDQLKWYINKLHEYNEIKDAAQMIMGKIAVLEQITVRKVHEQFGMTDND